MTKARVGRGSPGIFAAVVAVAVVGFGSTCDSPAAQNYTTFSPACGSPGDKIKIGGVNGCPGGVVDFTGSTGTNQVDGNSEVVIPSDARTGPLVAHCGSTMTAYSTQASLQIPCPADASPQDASPQDASGDASTCKTDGVCDAMEDCICADCATDIDRCGFGCTDVTVTDFKPPNLFSLDGKIGPIAGPAQDNLQALWKSGLAVGSETLATPANQSDVVSKMTLFQVVEDGFSKFFIQVSGTLDITQLSPLTGRLKNATFFPRVNGTDGGGGISADKTGKCYHIKSFDFPTP